MPDLVKGENERNRKYELNEEDLKVVESMASLGLPISDIASALCISESCLHRMIKTEYQEALDFEGLKKYKVSFLDQNVWGRYDRGLRRHKTIISKGLTEHAMKGNPQVLMFLARAKLGWNDKAVEEDQEMVNAEILSEIKVEFLEPAERLENSDEG